MSSKDVIARNLRVLRKIRGLTQPALADAVRMSPRTLARLEAGQVADPGIDQVSRLAAELGVPLEYLSGRRLVPLTLAVPEELKERLMSAEGLQILSQLANQQQVADAFRHEAPREASDPAAVGGGR